MKHFIIKVAATTVALSLLILSSCQKGNLIDNPNQGNPASVVPVSLILNHITATIIRPGEEAFGDEYKYGQFWLSNYQYYRGSNTYSWANTDNTYDILKYAKALEQQSTKQLGNQTNAYYALAQFFKAYAGIWLSQRVGDIPFSKAGDPANLTPSFDTQHDVYKNSFAYLETANTLLGNLNATASVSGATLDAKGDVFGLTNLQWQKAINTYRLRILISLSKRATDNPDLNIPQQFSSIVTNPTKYPIMTGNGDNMTYKYNTAFNPYPIFLRGNAPYNKYANMCSTFLDITTATLDPRTFIAATPAPLQIAAGKTVSDFTAYVGADYNLDLATLFNNGGAGQYSFHNYLRYYTSSAGANAEPYLFIGYPEMCFNIAEAINRGWVTSLSSATWYNNGINASLSFYGLTNGQVFTVGDLNGKILGTTTINLPAFLTNPAVVYQGDNAAGLTQILTQKYVAFWNNGGWEAFYNWRRTGVPAFHQGGAGIGTPSGAIPHRWIYPQDEITYNAANYNASITAQYGGKDQVTDDTWLTK